MKIPRTIKCLVIGSVSLALSGCIGGSIAQQLVSSMLIKGVDKATAVALDAQERNNKVAAQQMPLKDTVPDDYKVAFLNSGFENVAIQVEPLPEAPLEDEKPMQTMQETKLVQVEIWNFLIGNEKQRILEQARIIQGAAAIPPEDEWQQWQIAIGGAENMQPNTKQPSNNQARNKNNEGKQQAITFLIPPEIGKMHSGAKALVELSSVGELSIARYTVN